MLKIKSDISQQNIKIVDLQIWLIFTHLKWFAPARHNFKYMKIPIKPFGGYTVKTVSTPIEVFSPFYQPLKSLILGTNCVFNITMIFWSQILQIWVIFTHMKSWVAESRHTFKSVKI